MSINAFLFDLDGTLVDSIPDLTRAVNLLRNDLKRTWALVSSRWTARNIGRKSAERPRPAATAGSRARRGSFWITAVAASTGGPDSLAKVIPALPADYPTPVVVVQPVDTNRSRPFCWSSVSALASPARYSSGSKARATSGALSGSRSVTATTG